MEFVIYTVALIFCAFFAALLAIRYKPGSVSQYELHRRVAAGNVHAIAEHDRRLLLPTLIVLKNVKLVLVGAIIAALLVHAGGWALGGLLGFVYGLIALVLANQKWFTKPVNKIWVKSESKLWPLATKIQPYVRFMAPHMDMPHGQIGSPDELRHFLQNSDAILTSQDKIAVLAAFDASSLSVRDAMVPAASIATIGHEETVGPLLLDRLHKSGHKVFVVIGEGLNDIKGLLYLADVVNPHPNLVTVADATRPTVYYLGEDAPLSNVLAASIQTGRQLFLVGNGQEVVGLVTLADALQALTGYEVTSDANVVRTQP